MNKGCIEKVWMLDPHDKSCPKELHDEIFEKIQAGEISNGSVVQLSINDIKECYIDNEDEYTCPILIKYLEDHGFGEDEELYIHIYW